MRSPFTKPDRRQFLRAATAAGLTAGVAGCTDTAADDPAESSETTSNETTSNQTDEVEADDDDESAQEDGLDIDFTWEDIEQAELDHYERATRVEEALEVADKTRLENVDLLDYDEFQDVLLTTVNEIVHHFGESMDQDSSTTASTAAPAVNMILNDVLEENEAYQDEGLQIKMMPLTNDGHGYTQVASTHHPLTTVDSNAEAVGKPEERPLEEQRNVEVIDPISRFVDQDFEDVDELRRSTYHGFPSDIYSKGTDSSAHTGFKSSIIDSYYEEAIFTEEQEGRELWLGPVRQAVGTLRALWDEDYFEKEYIAISSPPSELPTIEEHENFDSYTETLIKDHIEKYAETHKMREAVLEP